MLNFSPRKAWGVSLLGLFGILSVTLSFQPASARDRMSGIGRPAEAGPDQAGGTQLLLEADIRGVARQRAGQMEAVLRSELRRNGVPVSQMQASTGEVRFLVDNPAQLRLAERLARGQIDPVANIGGPAWTVQVTGGRQIIVRQTQAGMNADIRQAMDVARDVIARRIGALGALEPTIVGQGTNRILVRVPGMQDPQTLASLIGRTARLEFKLVELNSVPCGTPRRPGIQILPADELPAGNCMGVQTRAMISDDHIADATQTFNENDEVAVQVRFNVQGSQRFAQVTQANVGRRFAIVVDNRIVSAPVIREPILGGTASIAGSFTVESANQLAISLRSGRLPVELHVVDQRSIGPNIRPDGAIAAND